MFNSAFNVVTNDAIVCPQNKYVQNYIWNDYFHDSPLKSIEHDLHKDTVTLIVESISDIDDAWDQIKGTRKEKLAYFNKESDAYSYKLIFTGCVYFQQESIEASVDILSSYFLKSANLEYYEKKRGKPLYHLRIVLSSGYMDLIFSDLRIKRVTNKRITVKELKATNEDPWLKKLQSYASRKKFLLEDNRIDELHLKEFLSSGTDYEKCIAFYYFLYYTDYPVIDEAKVRLKGDFATSILMTDDDDFDDDRDCLKYLLIRVIGERGSLEDIPLLMSFYQVIDKYYRNDGQCFINAVLPKRIIMDAIEMIHSRQI